MFVICHYGEIALKGRNRGFFEKKLIDNIKRTLDKGCFKFVKHIESRVVIELSEKADLKEIQKELGRVFGIVNFAFARQTKNTIKDIEKIALVLLKEKNFKTFRVEAKRSNKEFVFTSQEVNEKIGESVLKNNRLVEVKLVKPDITLFIEILREQSFVYTAVIKGLGGLPVGVSGKAVCLLSGGIDSPVAAFLAMKRGLEVIFCHFHTEPYTDKRSIEKVKDIVQILAKYQNGKNKLFLIPFAEAQKQIFLNTKEQYRVLLYRRLMFKIAEQIAEKENAKALLSGENLGQVASQTIENISVVEEAVNLPVLRPLITYDKLEIIAKAKEIKTYEISILPHQDCCSRFLPKNPATKANIKDVLIEERKLKIKVNALIDQSLKNH